jgi:hypothetical protein
MLNTIDQVELQGVWSELGTLWYSHVLFAWHLAETHMLIHEQA